MSDALRLLQIAHDEIEVMRAHLNRAADLIETRPHARRRIDASNVRNWHVPDERFVERRDFLAALRNRTSEPEAGAVACPACQDTWGECNTCGGSHKNDPRWIATHPAPATADKLRVAAKAVVLAAWTDRHSRLHGHETIAALDAALNEGGE